MATAEARDEELLDAAEDIVTILSALAAGALDLGPLTHSWLLDRLEAIERTLAERLNEQERRVLIGALQAACVAE